MADSLKAMGEMLPTDQWVVNINRDGTAEVCVSQLGGFRYWYSVQDVRHEGQDYETVTIREGRATPL
jgi:hypothetical protein